MKKIMDITLCISLLLLLAGCNNTITETTNMDTTKSENSKEVITTEAMVELIDNDVDETKFIEETTTTQTIIEKEEIFKFSNYSKLSGNNRIVEPLCAEFVDVKIKKGSLNLSDNEIEITGYLKGNENINNTLFPDDGLMVTLEAYIFDGDSINWQQKGYLKDSTYLKSNDKKEFLLINKGDTGNKVIIIAFIEGGMFEDEEMSDRGIFAVYESEFIIE